MGDVRLSVREAEGHGPFDISQTHEPRRTADVPSDGQNQVPIAPPSTKPGPKWGIHQNVVLHDVGYCMWMLEFLGPGFGTWFWVVRSHRDTRFRQVGTIIVHEIATIR